MKTEKLPTALLRTKCMSINGVDMETTFVVGLEACDILRDENTKEMFRVICDDDDNVLNLQTKEIEKKDTKFMYKVGQIKRW